MKYVLRPVLPSGCQAKSSYCSAVGSVDAVTLAGYGVELALKNMEYKAMDDTAVNKGCLMKLHIDLIAFHFHLKYSFLGSHAGGAVAG